ncbi:hypothetical protein L5M28_16860 [Shewanella sp. SW32]|uniref:hypothetical protein n=1 Tax=unclassified Shewanella TaxID=196818 RepID=UPI0021D9E891|nr:MULTISPECIES: hypothetical protein [unclassified Shewanella]MCU7964231.1 hypothetical protein [Shewanella sp. SW32]MCU7972136.1 hypothetical protein [Shewanella sp. SW29]
MECSTTTNNQDMCKQLEVNSFELFEVGVELSFEHPKAASFIFDIISYINRSRQLSSKTIRQALLSCSLPESPKPLLFIDQELFEELIYELSKLADELTIENQMAADILSDIINHITGEAISSFEVTKNKLISFSLSENTLQLNERNARIK